MPCLVQLVAELHPKSQEQLKAMAVAADKKQLGLLSWPSKKKAEEEPKGGGSRPAEPAAAAQRRKPRGINLIM